ncbi:MAG: N-acetyltransferase [Planctomycetota bacterium]
MSIRPEQPGDEAAVREVLLRAFDGPAEAELVDRLRAAGAATVSLVAELEGVIVGQILFSPVEIQGEQSNVSGVGLAPMAVLPDHQRSGIGGELVRAGLASCRELGEMRVVVLGHPDYYPRFGFVPASTFGIGCDYDVPDDVFMAQELEPAALHGVRGTVHYRTEFGEL